MQHNLKAPTAAALTAVAMLVIGVMPATAHAARWHVLKSRTARRGTVVTSLAARVKHPHGLAVDFFTVNANADANAIWSCKRGSTTRAFHHRWRGGRYVLPHVAGARSCRVTVAAFGQLPFTIKILVR